MNDQFLFQQDGAPCHTASYTQEFFERNNISVIDWPAQSPDLNPIENVWSFISHELKKSNIKNKQDLISEVTRIWYSIPKAYIQ